MGYGVGVEGVIVWEGLGGEGFDVGFEFPELGCGWGGVSPEFAWCGHCVGGGGDGGGLGGVELVRGLGNVSRALGIVAYREQDQGLWESWLEMRIPEVLVYSLTPDRAV